MLNDQSDPHHLPGAQVVKAWPGGSPDFELSWSRVEQFTEEVRQLGVQICDSIEEAATDCDAILLESADGRVHLEQFRKLIPFGKPVFIDKPLTCSLPEAEELISLAMRRHIPIMSSSSLRFLDGLPELVEQNRHAITGVELRGPLFFEETQPGYFWYGIHTLEMLFAILGPDFKSVRVKPTENADHLHAVWQNGIPAHLELIKDNIPFSGILICGEKRIPLPSSDKVNEPFYCSLLREVLHFFRTGTAPVPPAETLALIQFIEHLSSCSSQVYR
jgi:hypothetical protein